MKRTLERLLIASPCIALLMVFAASVMAQDAKPAPAPSATIQPDKPSDLVLTEDTDKLKVQLQLVLQENASLRKQLAQTQKALGEANSQLAEINEQQVKAAGPVVLKGIADKHGWDISGREFKIEPNAQGDVEFKWPAPTVDHPKEVK